MAGENKAKITSRQAWLGLFPDPLFPSPSAAPCQYPCFHLSPFTFHRSPFTFHLSPFTFTYFLTL
jgi:hypothetical protein